MNKTITKTYNLSTQILVDDTKKIRLKIKTYTDEFRNKGLKSMLKSFIGNIAQPASIKKPEDLNVPTENEKCINNTTIIVEDPPRTELYWIADSLYKDDFQGIFEHGYDKYTKPLKDVDMVLIENLIDKYIDENKNSENDYMSDPEFLSVNEVLFFLIKNDNYNLSDKLVDFFISKRCNPLGILVIDHLIQGRKKKDTRTRVKYVISKFYFDNKGGDLYRWKSKNNDLTYMIRLFKDEIDIFEIIEEILQEGLAKKLQVLNNVLLDGTYDYVTANIIF